MNGTEAESSERESRDQLADLDKLIDFAESIQENVKQASQKCYQSVIGLVGAMLLTAYGLYDLIGLRGGTSLSSISATYIIAGILGFFLAYIKILTSARDLRVERGVLGEVVQVLHETSSILLSDKNVRPLDRALYKMRLAKMRMSIPLPIEEISIPSHRKDIK